MYYAELNVPKNHVYLFKPQTSISKSPLETGGEMGYTHFHLARMGGMTDCPCGRGALVATAQYIQRYEIDIKTD